MVGVGGRSKACDNCRRRRVKCDLTTPECNRWFKAKLKCGGIRGFGFIQYSGSNCQDPALVKTSLPSPPSSGRSAIASPEQPAVMTTAISAAYMIPLRFLEPSLMPTAMDDIFVTCTHKHLLRESEDIVVKPGTDRTITGKCFVALATTMFGLDNRQKPVVQRGLRKYGTALKALNNALGDPKGSRSFDVLEAVIVMALFELLVGDREDGWIGHARGFEQLLKVRGPESMQELPCVIILERARSSIIFAALVTHTGTILSRPEWKEIPWLQHPERKDPLQLLIDIVADCPEIFVKRDEMLVGQMGAPDLPSLISLRSQARSVLQDLEAWENCRASTALSRWTEVASPKTTPTHADQHGASKPIWATVLEYHSLYDASISTTFNGALILVMMFIQGLNLLLQDLEQSGLLIKRMYSSAITICRSVDFHLERLRDVSSSSILFPMRMAYEVVGKTDKDIGAWLAYQLKIISSGPSGRWAMADHLLEMKAASTLSSGDVIETA
ncbi:hypothetical protein K456DRAFT_1870658 [Colletotrichum gloeosporioides 23]|nr:hypothetical protein K456DRAFT_1870658 [Colletotrichum gloeosporioides 23]